MASKAQIQTVKADFLDPSLYDDAGLSGLPRLSRGTVLAALSRAFDLAEGRRPGHARCLGFGDACGRIGSSGKRDASGIAAGSMQTGKDLDECGLPGAVLSEKGDDLARFDDETDIIDRDDTGIRVQISNPLRVGRNGTTPGAGLGLVGLAERAELTGGSLRHRINGRGEFELRAWLPCPP